MKRREFLGASVMTAGGLIVPAHVGATSVLLATPSQPSAAHDHYESELTRLDGLGELIFPSSTTAKGLRDQTEINAVSNADPSPGDNSEITFNSSTQPGTRQDGAKVTITKTGTEGSLVTGNQLWINEGGSTITTGTVWYQWECMWTSDYINVSAANGLNTHKYIQIANFEDTGDNRRIEQQIRYSRSDGSTSVGLATIRGYMEEGQGGDGVNDPLRETHDSYIDWQFTDCQGAYTNHNSTVTAAGHLGGTGCANADNPFVIEPDIWYMVTIEITMGQVWQAGDKWSVRSWWQREGEASATYTLADTSDTAFVAGNLQNGTSRTAGVRGMRFPEASSSQTVTDLDVISYIRNPIIASAEIQKTAPISPA